MHACLAQGWDGWSGRPSIFHLALPALERLPQSSLPCPTVWPGTWAGQVGPLARRGAAGEVASGELGTSMGQGSGTGSGFRFLPSTDQVRKLLGP